MRDHDANHRKDLIKILKKIQQTYLYLLDNIASLSLKSPRPEGLYTLPKNPKIQEIFAQYGKKTLQHILEGVTQAWKNANAKYDSLNESKLSSLDIPEAERRRKHYEKQSHNLDALNAFKERKTKGLKISDRVWKIQDQARKNIELALDEALTEGISAQELSRKLKAELQNPDALFRRVRDRHGNLTLSKAGQNYHPGQGVYRSAHKNALRLASNEINTAYREAEQVRLETNPDITGVEIHLSPSHKVYDICDELKGKYPKNFKWSKWHVNCKCYRTPILKTDTEIIEEIKQNTVKPPETSKNYVHAAPENFAQWLNDNKERLNQRKRLPEWIEDNQGYYQKRKDIPNKLDKLITPRERKTYVAFEPFSPIVMEYFAKSKDKYQKNNLFNEILNDKEFRAINTNEKTKRKVVIHPQSREPDSKNWNKTQAMAKALNKADKDVIFLPEYKDKPSADALIEFKGKYTIADFKYFTTTKPSNIANELRKTFKNSPTIVMKFDKIDTGILKASIEELKRKESLGNMIIINKYGKVVEISKSDIEIGKHRILLKGFL